MLKNMIRLFGSKFPVNGGEFIISDLPLSAKVKDLKKYFPESAQFDMGKTYCTVKLPTQEEAEFYCKKWQQRYYRGKPVRTKMATWNGSDKFAQKYSPKEVTN